MNYLTAQAATRLYEEYKDTEIAFTKEIVKTLRMDPRQVYIKFEGSQWPVLLIQLHLQMLRLSLEFPAGHIKLCQQNQMHR